MLGLQRAFETAIRSRRLFSDSALRDLVGFAASRPLPENGEPLALGPYVATPLPQADGGRLWRWQRGIRTPANPNAPTSRLITLPLPRMHGLATDPNLIKAPCIVTDDFAPEAIVAETLAALVAREAGFVTAETTDSDLGDLRRARTLAEAHGLEADWRAWILRETNSAMALLGMNERVAELEVQMTAHGNGGYYRPHRDVSDSPDTATRILTFVYYLSRKPRPFSGGQLKLYDYRCVDGIWQQAETFRLIEPEPNRLVFFPACFLHEVLPVQSSSGAFADSRFTVNGWVHRQP